MEFVYVKREANYSHYKIINLQKNMNINLQSKNFEITPEIHEYVMKRMETLSKLVEPMEVDGQGAVAKFEISKSTNHHKAGDVFHADCLIQVKGEEFYGSADEEDIHMAIDVVKDNLFREISKDKDRKQTLFKRGAASVKKMLKGLSKRNPFTSKY